MITNDSNDHHTDIISNCNTTTSTSNSATITSDTTETETFSNESSINFQQERNDDNYPGVQ